MKSELWDYLSEEFGLTPMQDEIHQILIHARNEIELPGDEEIRDEAYDTNAIRDENGFIILKYAYDDEQAEAFCEGAKWALNKVRNPYPKPL